MYDICIKRKLQCVGYTDHDQGKIFLQKDTKGKMRQVLIHEAIHVYESLHNAEIYKFRYSERDVQELSILIDSYLKLFELISRESENK